MRVILQRVSKASVSVDHKVVSKIKQGVLILLGIEMGDTLEDIDWLVKKISQLRIFSDQHGLMNQSVLDINGEALVVSQFTLYGSTKKGNRPSFIRAAKPDVAQPIYELFNEKLSTRLAGKVKTGIFGANMEITLLNDGPVTLFIDTKMKE